MNKWEKSCYYRKICLLKLVIVRVIKNWVILKSLIQALDSQESRARNTITSLEIGCI